MSRPLPSASRSLGLDLCKVGLTAPTHMMPWAAPARSQGIGMNSLSKQVGLLSYFLFYCFFNVFLEPCMVWRLSRWESEPEEMQCGASEISLSLPEPSCHGGLWQKRQTGWWRSRLKTKRGPAEHRTLYTLLPTVFLKCREEKDRRKLTEE